MNLRRQCGQRDMGIRRKWLMAALLVLSLRVQTLLNFAFSVSRQGLVRRAASETASIAAEKVEKPQEEERPWDQLAKTSSELFEDTSEFFEDTMSAAFERREEELAAVTEENTTDIAELLQSAGSDSVAGLQEALSAQAQSLSSLTTQAASLATPPAEFLEGLSAVFRSVKEVEERVATVVGEAVQPGQQLPDSPSEAALPESALGLSVHDAAARRGADGGWVVPIQAWVFRRNNRQHRIRMALCRKILIEMMYGITDVTDEQVQRYEDRGRLIFRTLAFRGGERNVQLSIKFDGEDEWRDLPQTEGNGRVEVDVSVPDKVAAEGGSDGTLGFQLRIEPKKGEDVTVVARASALLFEPDGLMVISDIDDTVKVTEVFLGQDMVVRNTFLEEFRAVSGMVPLYQSWAQEFGANFAFVSHSPPELQEPLRKFLVDSGFPQAPVFLRPLGGSKEERLSFKQRTITELLRQYPRRKVVLVGDSGERDPVICADLLRRHPAQVAKVLIRQVSPNSSVKAEVFNGILPSRWQVFADPSEVTLPDELRDLGSVPGILRYAASIGSAALRGAASVTPGGKTEV